MATSSAFSTSNDYIKYTISITQNSRNVTNNTSSVTVAVRVYRTNTGYTTYGTGKVTCKINGVTYTSNITSSQAITNGGIVLFTKTLNISHNADGSKTLVTSASITHTQFTSSSNSYSQTLTAIPRATTPTLSASSVNMGAVLTINTPRASGDFTHTLTYSFSGGSGTIAVSVGTSYAWTVPLSLASRIPNATSGTCTITCITYNGNTRIGTKSVSFTAKVPSTVVPSISAISVTEATDGLAAQFAGFVQNKSKLNVNITASGAYSSTIKSYKTIISGKTYTTSSFTTSVISTSGSVNITTTITDSRGRTASKTITITVYAYAIPRIVSFNVARCTADGTEADDGTYLKATYQYSVSPVNNKNHNGRRVQVLNASGAWETLNYAQEGYTFTGSYVSTTTFDTESSFEIRLMISDYFGATYATATLTTAFTLLDFNASGKGMAVGKVSERDGFEVGIPSYFSVPPIIGGENKILWSGSWYMTADHRAALSESITNQMNGVVLVFSKYENGAVADNNFQTFFISKHFIERHKGYGNTFVMAANKFLTIATKYLYVNDTYITGHADNNATGTVNGITYNNASFVMRYVIGV